MCLWVNLDDQKEFKKKNGRGSVTAYKVVMYNQNYAGRGLGPLGLGWKPNWGLKSIYFDYWWIPGIQKAKGAKKHKRLWDGKEVNIGIHVFLTRKRAVKYISDQDGNNRPLADGWRQIIIPVKCSMKNLVAVGQGEQAVFTQVTFEKTAYQRAMRTGAANAKQEVGGTLIMM